MYYNQILELYRQGRTAEEIHDILFHHLRIRYTLALVHVRRHKHMALQWQVTLSFSPPIPASPPDPSATIDEFLLDLSFGGVPQTTVALAANATDYQFNIGPTVEVVAQLSTRNNTTGLVSTGPKLDLTTPNFSAPPAPGAITQTMVPVNV